jgi:hypothetical protein
MSRALMFPSRVPVQRVAVAGTQMRFGGQLLTTRPDSDESSEVSASLGKRCLGKCSIASEVIVKPAILELHEVTTRDDTYDEAAS